YGPDFDRFDPFLSQAAHLGHVHQCENAALGRHRADIEIAADRHRLEKTFKLAILGDIDDAVAHGWLRDAIAHRAAVKLDLAAVQHVAFEHAGDNLGGLGAAGTNKAEHAGHLAGEHRERSIAHHRSHGKILHAQHLATAFADRPAPRMDAINFA